MKFRLWSDVHCDFGAPVFHSKEDDHDTTLIIAGDWATAGQPNSHLIEQLCDRFRYVLFVSGNHDYWASDVEITDKFWASLQEKHANFRYLNPGMIFIDDVLVIGATLWTDCCRRNPLEVGKIRKYMTPDFNFIHDFKKDAFEWVNLHDKHRAFIQDALYENYLEMKTLVVTHHAPHGRCDPDHSFNAGFVCTDMDELINPKLVHTWAFGHTHVPVEFELNGVRMISNPRGYKDCESLADTWELHELDAKIWEI